MSENLPYYGHFIEKWPAGNGAKAPPELAVFCWCPAEDLCTDYVTVTQWLTPALALLFPFPSIGNWLEIAPSKSTQSLKPYLPWADASLILCNCSSGFDGSLSSLAEEWCQFSQPVSMSVHEFAAALFFTDKPLFDLTLCHLLSSHDETRGIISWTQETSSTFT